MAKFIYLPFSIRQKYQIEQGDKLELYTDGYDIYIKALTNTIRCCICDTKTMSDIIYKGFAICKKCYANIKNDLKNTEHSQMICDTGFEINLRKNPTGVGFYLPQAVQEAVWDDDKSYTIKSYNDEFMVIKKVSERSEPINQCLFCEAVGNLHNIINDKYVCETCMRNIVKVKGESDMG